MRAVSNEHAGRHAWPRPPSPHRHSRTATITTTTATTQRACARTLGHERPPSRTSATLCSAIIIVVDAGVHRLATVVQLMLRPCAPPVPRPPLRSAPPIAHSFITSRAPSCGFGVVPGAVRAVGAQLTGGPRGHGDGGGGGVLPVVLVEINFEFITHRRV